MANQEEVFDKIASVMEELFEIERSDITLDANLYEDLDIDSIDAVDLVVELKKYTGKQIQPDDFKSVRTVGDVVIAVGKLLED